MSAQDVTVPTRVVLVSMLGYIGAFLALASTGIVFEESTGTTGRALLDLGTMSVLLVAGLFAGRSREDSYRRMRSVFWLVALFSWGDLLSIVFGPEGADLDGRSLVLAIAAGVAVVGAALWWVERRSLQLVAVFVSVHVAVVAAVYQERSSLLFGSAPDPTPPGIATVALGLAALLLGVFGVLKPRTTALVLGSIAMIAGSFFIDASIVGGVSDLGLGIALAFSLGSLLLGDQLGVRAVAGIGIVGTLASTGSLVASNIHTRSNGIVVLVVGIVMLAAAVALVRWRGGSEAPAEAAAAAPPPAPGRPD